MVPVDLWLCEKRCNNTYEGPTKRAEFTVLSQISFGAGPIDTHWALRLAAPPFLWQPAVVLDVGANHGAWTQAFHRVWKHARFIMCEANPTLESDLRRITSSVASANRTIEYHIAILGNETRSITFFMARHGARRADKGSSLFLEGNNAKSFEAQTRQQHTLDELLANASAKYPPVNMLKVDAQGAELLILHGAQRVLTSVEVIFLELSVSEYNQGSPRWFEVHSGVDHLGFRAWDISEQHRGAHGILLQIDIVFVRKGHLLWTKRPQDRLVTDDT